MRKRMTLWDAARAVGETSLAKMFTIPVWTRDPFRANFAPVEPAQLYRSRTHRRTSPPEAPTSLRVMTWNIKYGGGRLDFFYDGHGERILMRPTEVLDHLDAIARVIRFVNPDVLFIQEIDRAAYRSAMIDQVRWLLDQTPLHHAAYAAQWRADLIPSRRLGKVDGGVAILSKYPLRQAQRIALPLIGEQDGLTQYFFLRRCILSAELDLGHSAPLGLLCTHTSAFTTSQTKLAQLMWLKRYMDALSERGLFWVAGADLNVLPPGSSKLSDFPDVAPTEDAFLAADFSGQPEWLRPFYRDYTPAIALERYLDEEALHYSHSTHGGHFWSRKLDYLFTNASWQHDSTQTLQSLAHGGIETMPCSDHAPLVGTLGLGEREV